MVMIMVDRMQNRLIEPLSTNAKLIFARVHRETKALLCGITPNATAFRFQTRRTIVSLLTCDRATVDIAHSTRRSSNTCTPGIVRPPFACVRHAVIAGHKIRAIGTFGWIHNEIAPVGAGRCIARRRHTRQLFVKRSWVTAVGQIAPATAGIRQTMQTICVAGAVAARKWLQIFTAERFRMLVAAVVLQTDD